jgi:outer membrane protein OmpA-like peptidoglycan-associated protein
MKKVIFISCLLFCFIGHSQKQFDVFFDFNKDIPNSILEVNEWVSQNKNAEILKVYGYCDSVDTNNYNKKLAERRIENVLLLLEKSGVKINTEVQKVAYGKDFVQSKIQSQNRKVTVFYKDPQPVVVESELTEAIKKAKVGETIKLPNICFYNNVAKILPKSQPTLAELLCAMEENPKLKIEIQGHICCQKGSDVNNVSFSRARAVYLYLVQNKIDKNRMTYKGYGVSKPIHPIPEKNAQEEEENRRVEVLIIEN